MTPNVGSEFREEVARWTCNHFSIHSTSGDVPWLLRELAARITELGDINVIDVVITPQDDPAEGVTGTVYFSFHDIPSSS